jgi:tetrahydromethanopterin S-methyltransferase subunit C
LAGNKLGSVTIASLDNPFINIVISMIIGVVLGYISQKIAVALVKE